MVDVLFVQVLKSLDNLDDYFPYLLFVHHFVFVLPFLDQLLQRTHIQQFSDNTWYYNKWYYSLRSSSSTFLYCTIFLCILNIIYALYCLITSSNIWLVSDKSTILIAYKLSFFVLIAL